MPTLVPISTCCPLISYGTASASISLVASVTGVLRLVDARLDDGELVTAKTRHRVRLSRMRQQPQGHFPQQSVSGRMAKRVVHRLEVIEVEVQDGAGFSPLAPCHRFAQFVTKRDAVWQSGQRIMAGHVRHLVFGKTPLRDVIEGYEPVFVLHRHEVHRQGAPIGQFTDTGVSLARGFHLFDI